MSAYNYLTGETVDFTDGTARRLAIARQRLYYCALSMGRMVDRGTGRAVMFTLTYKEVTGWRNWHMAKFMDWFRDRFHVKPYAWCMELQKRGAPHYHLLTVLDLGERWDFGVIRIGWPHGFYLVTDPVRKVHYVGKYLSKQKAGAATFPKGARIAGYSRNALDLLTDEERCRYRVAKIPQWAGSKADIVGLGLIANRSGNGVTVGGLEVYSPFRDWSGSVTYCGNGLRVVNF